MANEFMDVINQRLVNGVQLRDDDLAFDDDDLDDVNYVEDYAAGGAASAFPPFSRPPTPAAHPPAAALPHRTNVWTDSAAKDSKPTAVSL